MSDEQRAKAEVMEQDAKFQGEKTAGQVKDLADKLTALNSHVHTEFLKLRELLSMSFTSASTERKGKKMFTQKSRSMLMNFASFTTNSVKSFLLPCRFRLRPTRRRSLS